MNFQNQNIELKSKEFLDNCKSKHFFKETVAVQNVDNQLSLFREVASEKIIDAPLNGENALGNAILTNISDQTYIIPPNCRFTNSCVSEIEKFASELYDFIVIDPPWWNKFIRRVRSCKREEGLVSTEIILSETIFTINSSDMA